MTMTSGNDQSPHTAPADGILCTGEYTVTSADIIRFREQMGYPASPEGTQPVAPSSMGLTYGLRLGWEHKLFPPGSIRMGDKDVFGVQARPGDRLRTEMHIVDRFEKNGRKFCSFEMSTRNQSGELVCSVTFTAIIP